MLKRGRASEREMYSSNTRTLVSGMVASIAANSFRSEFVIALGFEILVRMTIDMMLNGICVCGRYISGESSFFNERCFTFPTRPTISRIFSPLSSAENPGLMRLPMTFCPGKYFCANRSFTITTGTDSNRSRSSKIRPCLTGIPIVLK